MPYPTESSKLDAPLSRVLQDPDIRSSAEKANLSDDSLKREVKKPEAQQEIWQSVAREVEAYNNVEADLERARIELDAVFPRPRWLPSPSQIGEFAQAAFSLIVVLGLGAIILGAIILGAMEWLVSHS